VVEQRAPVVDDRVYLGAAGVVVEVLL